MEIYCEKCTREVPFDDINIKEGVYSCIHCSEVFKVKQAILNHPKIASIEKPEFTKIKIAELNDSTEITTPMKGLLSFGNIFLLLFSVIWNSIVVGIMFQDEKTPISFRLIFLGVGVLVFSIFLVSAFGSNKIIITRNHFIKVFKILELPVYERKVILERYNDVVEKPFYTSNERPVYGIAILFTGKNDMKFATNLSSNERKWLINIIHNTFKRLNIDESILRLEYKSNNKSPISR